LIEINALVMKEENVKFASVGCGNYLDECECEPISVSMD